MPAIKIPKLDISIFTALVTVRISDINYGNHLGHDALISLLHEARLQFLQTLGYSEMNVEGLGILITNLHVNYINEAFYGDVLNISIGISEINRSSVELLYEVIKSENQKLIARATTMLTFFDYNERKVARVPNAFLTQLKLNN